MKGRKPEPTHLKLLKGNPGKRAINHNEPNPPSEEPSMPEELDADGRKHWKFLVEKQSEMGTLAACHKGIMFAACLAYSVAVKSARKFNEFDGLVVLRENNPKGVTRLIKNPIVSQMMEAAGNLARFEAQPGLDPTSRTKIQVDKKGDPSLAEIMNKFTTAEVMNEYTTRPN